MKQIPNIFTLLNLVFGCLAIVAIMQPGVDSDGQQWIMIPEKMYLASLFIAIAAVIDFLDGLIARIMNVASEMGKQIDSLADVVSFGVAPGMIIYQFLRLSYAQQQDGLDVNIGYLLPAFIVSCAGAYRLARFNIDTQQTTNFKGVPIPAAGILVASFPLVYFFGETNGWLHSLMLNVWFWYALIIIVSVLMVSTLPMLALKFKNVSLKKLLPFIIIAAASIIAAIFLGWLAVPIGFIFYVALSLVFAKNEKKESIV
jgi:CDP-diacylglycerol--serine O-phosphatidyltransferase